MRIEIEGEEPETVLDATRSITVSTFAIRKLLLTHDIDPLFVFPGGVGTFDELFDVLVQQDTGRLGWFPAQRRRRGVAAPGRRPGASMAG